MPAQTCIMIIPQSDLIGHGLKIALSRVGYSARVLGGLNPARDQAPDLLFLECPDESLNLLHRAMQMFPRTPVAVLSRSLNPVFIWQMVDSGAAGYLYLGDKLADRIGYIAEDLLSSNLVLTPSAQASLAALRHYREQPLTDYQETVLRLMIQGRSASLIARDLGRTVTAIYQVQRHLRDTFDATSNGDLVHRVQSLRLLDKSQP